MLSINQRALLASVACGAMLVLAFAPFNYWGLAPLSIAALWLLVSSSSPSTAFWRGLAFGYGLYVAGVSWVYVSLSTYGGMPLWMGSIAVLGFAGILSLFIAVPAYLVARLLPQHEKARLIALPFAWVVFEWMKSWVLTGFPWLDLGYTQTATVLLAWAPIGGVYMVSLMVAAIAAVLAWVFRYRQWLLLLVIPILLSASWALDRIQWSEDATEPLMVGVVQANVPINQKWQPVQRDELIRQYHQLSQALVASKVDLIVWPETALPLHMQQTSPEFWRSIVPAGATLLAGIVDTPSLMAQPPSYDESYNAAALVCGEQVQLYRKRHLVPFGEYMPLRFLFGWVLDYLELPMSDFSYWEGIQPLHCADRIKIGLSICYEDAFANEYRENLGDATILVNISEDAWFGDSLAPHQRLQMAQMRARELSRPMVRSANSGPSVILDHRGQVLTSTSQFAVATLSHQVVPQSGQTPFVRFGVWVVYVCLIGLALVIFLARKRQRRKPLG